jgi:hypothetical protein
MIHKRICYDCKEEFECNPEGFANNKYKTCSSWDIPFQGCRCLECYIIYEQETESCIEVIKQCWKGFPLLDAKLTALML